MLSSNLESNNEEMGFDFRVFFKSGFIWLPHLVRLPTSLWIQSLEYFFNEVILLQRSQILASSWQKWEQFCYYFITTFHNTDQAELGVGSASLCYILIEIPIENLCDLRWWEEKEKYWTNITRRTSIRRSFRGPGGRRINRWRLEYTLQDMRKLYLSRHQVQFPQRRCYQRDI